MSKTEVNKVVFTNLWTKILKKSLRELKAIKTKLEDKIESLQSQTLLYILRKMMLSKKYPANLEI